MTSVGSSKAVAGEEFEAFVAIDWADEEHAWALQRPDGGREHGQLTQRPEAIEEWVRRLSERFPGGKIAVALEQARGALLYALSQYTPLVLFPIHPSTSARYRSALFPSGAKDDPKDASLLLDLLVLHRDHLRPLQPDVEAVRKRQRLVEKRRQLVDHKTACSNRLTAELKLYFPQALRWFDDPSTPVFTAFLERWPTVTAVQTEAPETMLAFLHQHNCRSGKRNQQRLEEMCTAMPLSRDPAIVEPAALLTKIWLRELVVLREGIAALDQAIEQVCQGQADYALFASFPGAGPALAPRLLAAFGSQRERFAKASQLQAFSGIAPVVAQSGKSKWIHCRWACPKFLRQTFQEFAGASIPQCAWARAFYRKQRQKGSAHHAAVRSLAFKWIRILFRCWQARTPYQESLYLAQTEHRASPPKQLPEKPVDFQWNHFVGFSKLSRSPA